MNYNNFHKEKPNIDELIVWLDCQLREVFGYYRGKLYFEEVNLPHTGYLPKFWRETTDIESNQFKPIPIIKRGRGRPKKHI